MADRRMSDAFFEMGFGTELNVMSATPDQKVAISYAVQNAKGRLFLLEISCDEESRGCSTSWISVYPKEAEELLPLLTVLEPNGDSRDEEVPTEMMSEAGMHVGSDHAQPRRLAKRIVPVKPVILQDF